MIWSYFFIGFIWLLICDLFVQKMPNNFVRARYWLLWPVTFSAFVIGFINAVIDKWNDEEM